MKSGRFDPKNEDRACAELPELVDSSFRNMAIM